MWRDVWSAFMATVMMGTMALAQYNVQRLPCIDMMVPVLLRVATYRDCEMTSSNVGECAKEALAALSRLGEVLARDDCQHEITSYLREKVVDVSFDKILSIPVEAANCPAGGKHEADVCLQAAGQQLAEAVVDILIGVVPSGTSEDAKEAIAAVGQAFNYFVACMKEAPLLVSTVSPNDLDRVAQRVMVWKAMVHSKMHGAIDDTSANILDLLLGTPEVSNNTTDILPSSLRDNRPCKDQWLNLKDAIIGVLQSPVAATALEEAKDRLHLLKVHGKWVEMSIKAGVPQLLNDSSCVFEWADMNDLEECSDKVSLAMKKYEANLVALDKKNWYDSAPVLAAVLVGMLAGLCAVGSMSYWVLKQWGRRGGKSRGYRAVSPAIIGMDSQSGLAFGAEDDL